MADKYCPDWVFDATVAEVAMQFLLREYPLPQIALKHSQGLSKLYLPIEIVEVQSSAEELLSFLSEINANEEAVNYLSGFSFFRVNFKSNKIRRKLNSALFQADAGSNFRDYSGTKTLTAFRAYVHAVRADVDMPKNHGWSLSLLHEMPHLASISKSLTDSLSLDVKQILP